MGGLVKYQDQTGNLVAIAKNFEVQILETNTLRILNKFQFTDVVSQLESNGVQMYR